MGDPKKKRKKFEKPRKVWDAERLETDMKLLEKYGLKNMRELWRARTMLRLKRQNARKMLALPIQKRERLEKELIGSLARIGLLKENAGIDDVLSLEVEALLERRLQTIVLRKNLALTPKQARQFITHGKIAVGGKKVTIPSFLVSTGLEASVGYFKEPMKIAIEEKPKQKSTKEEFEEAKPSEDLENPESQEEAKEIIEEKEGEK